MKFSSVSRLALVAFAAIPVSLCGAASMAQATSVASPDIHFVVQVADSDSTTAGNSLATARYSVTLTGMLVASQVQLFVDNNPTALATGVADGSGNYSSIVSLPTDLIVGGHVITASGTTAAGIPFTNTVASFNVTSSGSVTPGSSGDGTLSLVVPASASSTLNPATLVNNISTSTGTLGQFSVNDQRTVSKQGWTLYADVTDFVLSTNPATTISKTQLGTAPQSVSGSTEATGITLGAATNPGAATYPMVFAEAAAQSSAVGLSTFDAALTFVAPQQYPVGTYNATVTITLVSK